MWPLCTSRNFHYEIICTRQGSCLRSCLPLSLLTLPHSSLEVLRAQYPSNMVAANASSSPIVIYDLTPQPGICPYVQRAKIVLKEKGLHYDTVYIDKSNKAQDFLDLFRHITSNPNHRGTVPILIDGDKRIAESEVVSEYLDLTYPEHSTRLFPTDPYKLSLVRLFVINFTTQYQPAAAKLLSATTLQEYREAQAGFIDALKILDTFLKVHGEKSGDFLLGSNFTYAEAATLPFLVRAAANLSKYRNTDVDSVFKEHKLDHLRKWKEAGFARPSVTETSPPHDIIIGLGQKTAKVPMKELK